VVIELDSINASAIRDIATASSYNKGLEYFKSNKVAFMSSDTQEYITGESSGTHVYGKVESSVKDYFYHSEALIGMGGSIASFHCTCEAFHSLYNGKAACKHIVALLLKFMYKQELSSGMNKLKSFSKTDVLVDLLKKGFSQELPELKKELKLEVGYTFEYINGRISSIDLRIGEDRTYVVKNIRQLLYSISTNSGSIEYSKFFSFNPLVHTFSEVDQEIINLLLELYEIDFNIPQTRGYGNENKLLSGKKAFLTDIQTKRFFDILKDKTIKATILGREYVSVNILNSPLPIEFNLKQRNGEILLYHSDGLPIPLTTDGHYFFYKSSIYNLPKEQYRIYLPLYNAFVEEKSNVVTFKDEEREKIASYIMPGLKKISSSINIDPVLRKSFIEAPLKSEVYLDKVENGIAAIVRFIYGSISINPVAPRIEEGSPLLIRDVEEELEILTLLEKSGFRKGEENYLLKDEERLVDFLTDGMIALGQKCSIYYSEEFKQIKIYSSESFKASVRLTSSNLLEFSFNIDGVDKKELVDIFHALKEKKKYFRLKNGSFIPLTSHELIEVSSILDYLDIKDSQLSRDKMLVKKFNALYIDQSLRNTSIEHIERNRSFRDLVGSISDIQDLDYKVPSHLDRVLRNYQKTGFKWMKALYHNGFGGILADEMGLGKTLQTIAFLSSELSEQGRDKSPALVVAPTSLIYNWEAEIQRFSPELKVLVLSGNKATRTEKLQDLGDMDIIITSYPLIRRDIEYYEDFHFSCCILDEAQQIKNPLSMNAKSVKRINAGGYLALTGTPMENSLMELWSIFDFLMPGYLLSSAKFSKRYETPIVKNNSTDALKDLNRRIRPFILRRLKKDVMLELPPKIEHKLLVEMTEEQKEVYMAYLAAVKGELEDEIEAEGFKNSKLKILSALTRLRQICCDPSVFLEDYQGESGKLLALQELLEETLDGGHRVLLFSQFTSMLKIIESALASTGISTLYLDGSTPTESRLDMVNSFNSGKGEVFLISLKAGGTGLNLTGADVVIHYDPWWNPAVEDQATDRAHRIGQQKTVEVIRLISRGTIEEKICALQERKSSMIKEVVGQGSTDESLLSSLTQEELKELFTT
jgi:SNF2 family DNA or RNA helicase